MLPRTRNECLGDSGANRCPVRHFAGGGGGTTRPMTPVSIGAALLYKYDYSGKACMCRH